MIRTIHNLFRRKRIWEIDLLDNGDVTRIRVHLTKGGFEQLFIEYVEHGIRREDIVPFIKRFIEEDEGEWVEVNGERYPEE